MQDTRIDGPELIARLKLQPHPEGGYFREVYRGDALVRRDGSEETHSASTAIYFLLCDGAYSSWHRIRSDELWHFYAGDPIHVHVIDAKGALTTLKLGNALLHDDAVFQAAVKAENWFVAECIDPSGIALVGCTVASGFEFSEFEFADSAALETLYPQHREFISRLAPR
ncbi:hypothetical protein BPMI_03537c [Candidatus Burkholderia pumila]|uniref:DUF985 domain-containing protein n=1 Tax=Candidatus Burkholderia pumila TaxID=1090375 RepID=A0ABR5HM26_9BURK|nr:hypothetical protein BPMI_03537c [Candidatus Burkholderia pumila]